MKAKKQSDSERRQIFDELKEDPLHKFNLAFALMSLIPILCFIYLLAGDLFSFKILEGSIGFMVFLVLLLSLVGFFLGQLLIRNLLTRTISYMVKLRENDRQKSIFVARVSHEIKNPLSALNLSISTILDSIIDKIDEEQKEMFSRCKSVCERLIRFATEMLNVSKIESGMVEMKRSLVELNKMIEEEIKIFETAFNKKQIKLTANYPFPRINIWADRDKIAEVVFNLIDNAIKYTPQKGKVSLNLSDEGGYARFEICDTGIGISEDKVGEIFNKFDKISSKSGSTGLGLVIAKDIIDLHRGKIILESKLNQGSKFIILLPKDLRTGSR